MLTAPPVLTTTAPASVSLTGPATVERVAVRWEAVLPTEATQPAEEEAPAAVPALVAAARPRSPCRGFAGSHPMVAFRTSHRFPLSSMYFPRASTQARPSATRSSHLMAV